MTFRVSQLVWSIVWEDCPEGEGKELVLKYCRDTSAYRVVEGLAILKNAMESKDEFICATILT